MKRKNLKRKWQKDIDKDCIRELQMDDKRLIEKEKV